MISKLERNVNPLIIYYSKTGNTEKILSGLSASAGVDFIRADEVLVEDVQNRPIIGFASGIYWGKHHSLLFKAADKLTRGCPVFIVSSSGFQSRFLVTVYTLLLKLKLKILGLHLVGEWHCPGHDKSKDPLFRWLSLSKGRPNRDDLQAFNSFMIKMIENRRLVE
jgi:hypothetical protein